MASDSDSEFDCNPVYLPSFETVAKHVDNSSSLASASAQVSSAPSTSNTMAADDAPDAGPQPGGSEERDSMDQWSKSTSAPLCRELISFLESIETVVRLDGMLDAATTGPPDSPKFEPYGGLAFSGSPATAESSGPDADF